MAIPSFSPLFPCQGQGCGVNNGVKHDKAADHMNSKGASTLSPDEITELHSLALQLGQATDGVSQYLLGRFAQSTRELLSTYDPAVTDVEALRSALANELSLVINGEPIFEAQRFAGVKLSNATQQCVGRQLKGLGPTRFNRLLLEDSFPLALAKQPKPRQKQKTVRVGTGLFRIVGIQGIYGKKKIKGKTHVTALQTDDPEQAREKYEEWVVGLRKSLKLVCAEQGTLASFVEPYLTSRAPEVARNKLKPSTIVGQRKSFQLLGEHWKEFRTLPISDLLPETITNLQNHLLTKARNLRTGQPLKLGTYNSLICPLGQLLEYLAREGKLPKERYYALKERIKLADVPSRKVELPTTEQFQKMRAYLYRARWGRGRGECGPKFDVFVLTGIRNATLTAMRVKHIHFAKRTILFTRLKGHAGQADEKELPVVDEVLEVLERHIKARGLQPDVLVFQTKRSNAAFRAAAKYAGIATWFQHACRKWFATQALAQTNDAMSVADMLCHRDGGLALFKAYRQSFAAHLEGTVRTLKLLPGATADSSLGAAKARAERALLKFAGLDRDKSAAVLDHILWLESEIDLGHYDIISRLPGLRQPILPMHSPSAKPLCRHPSPSLLRKNLRHLLKKKGVYYSDVAVATGFPRTTIARAFMYGNAQATMIPVFSKYFSVGIEELLTADLELAEARQPRDGTPPATNQRAQEAIAPNPPPAAKQDSEPGQDQVASCDSVVFARNLKSILFEKNLTLPKLARLSGVYQQDIYRYAKEERDPAPPALSRIAQALQVSEAELVNPARNNLIVDSIKALANLKAILAHHGCTLVTYANRLAMAFDSNLLENGEISANRAHKIAQAERISVRQLISEDVSHLFPARPQVDLAVLSRNLRSLCWEKGLSPNEIAIKSGVTANVAMKYFNGKTKRACHHVLERIATAMGLSLDELLNPARPCLQVTCHFRTNLQHLVQQSGRSAATISQRCGLHYRTFAALLEGAEPTPNQITRIARCFDLTQADLLMRDLGRVSTASQASSVPADHPMQRQQLENPPAQVPETCPI